MTGWHMGEQTNHLKCSWVTFVFLFLRNHHVFSFKWKTTTDKQQVIKAPLVFLTVSPPLSLSLAPPAFYNRSSRSEESFPVGSRPDLARRQPVSIRQKGREAPGGVLHALLTHHPTSSSSSEEKRREARMDGWGEGRWEEGGEGGGRVGLRVLPLAVHLLQSVLSLCLKFMVNYLFSPFPHGCKLLML